MQSDYQLLIAKLDAFIRKYYKDRLIRGALYATGLLASLFLATALLEHLGHFGTSLRTLLFWGFVLSMGLVLGRFVVQPLVMLMRLGPIISHEEAARIIGSHFNDVRDKLLNTLQLHDLAAALPNRRELIEAAIAQRSRELGPVSFVRAIDLRRNRRYLRYAAPRLPCCSCCCSPHRASLPGPRTEYSATEASSSQRHPSGSSCSMIH